MKPDACPFCKADAARVDVADIWMPDGGNQWTVVCNACHAYGPSAPKEETAIQRWNAVPR